MYLLDLKYELKHVDDVFVFSNLIYGSSEFAFKGKCNYFKLKTLLYRGFRITESESKGLENKVVDLLINKKPELFIELTSETEVEMYTSNREFIEIHKNSFFHRDGLAEFLQKCNEYTLKGKALKLALDGKYSNSYFQERLKRIPFVEIHTSEKAEAILCDYRYKCQNPNIRYLIYLSNTAGDILIGPLIDAENFVLNNDQHIVSENPPLHENEMELISFFLHKIIYLLLFELYDQIDDIPYFPSRYGLQLNRVNLSIKTSSISLREKKSG